MRVSLASIRFILSKEDCILCTCLSVVLEKHFLFLHKKIKYFSTLEYNPILMFFLRMFLMQWKIRPQGFVFFQIRNGFKVTGTSNPDFLCYFLVGKWSWNHHHSIHHLHPRPLHKNMDSLMPFLWIHSHQFLALN